MTGSGFKKDPAIERWAAMREHTHFYYRFNFRKIIPTAVLLIGIPAGIVYFSLKSFVRTGMGFNEESGNYDNILWSFRIIMRN